MATEPRSTTAPCVDGELMPQRQVLEDEISAGADRCEECCDKQTEVEHRRASRGSPILCYLSIEPHGSSFAVPREASGEAKTRSGAVEAIRALRTARRSAGHARTTALNQMRALLVSGPDDLRAALRGRTVFELVTTAARLRPTDPTTAVGATKLALRELARRVQRLEAERRRLDAVLEQLVATTAPALVACFGVGTDTAGALLVSAGDNPQRLRSEAAFAHHCGVAPIDASSGLTIRKRLNRGGDRTANQALWRIVMVRMVHDPRTRRYVERRTREGRSKREIIRSLKRYVARQLYRHLPRAESLA